jgi:hypothetical protein
MQRSVDQLASPVQCLVVRRASSSNRARLVVVALLSVFALLATTAAGCGKDEPTTAPPVNTPRSTASPSSSATPSGSPSPGVEFSVDGAGPYQLGASLTELQSANLLDEIAKGTGPCPQNTTARGTSTWGDVHLSFRADGKLYLLINRSTSIPTPSGAWLGTSLTDLMKIYAAVPGQVLRRGSTTGYLVTTLSGRGILFELDTTQKVMAMTAGESGFLRTNFNSGTDFC